MKLQPVLCSRRLWNVTWKPYWAYHMIT